ncbi:MAG TPA: DNA polymerase III subunit gamma/tau [Alloprevotella sp.]|nr:DNA polymerase III subunit gamma/tau [Alloprevotella sp.]
MDNYIVSARKYRPATFDHVIGQKALTTTLKNAIATGKLAHAYLFCGPRGVGKTTCARIFAKTINCLAPTDKGEACNQCESCRAFNENRSYNIHELDAASNNSVEDIRSLIEQVRIPPQVGKYKVFIIDEVHMLSAAAFNAFLKTLEEPPAHAIFILATTEKHKILPTILSRCQIYDFNRMEAGAIVEHLKHVADNEGYTYEEEALGVIAHKADGGMRDALSIFDQVASFTGGNISYKKVIEDLNVLDYDYYFSLTDSLLKTDIPAALLTLNEILSKGFEANHFIGGLASHFRDLLVSRDAVTLPLLEVADSIRQRYSKQAGRCKLPFLYKALKLCNNCDLNYRTSRNKRLLVEITLIEVAQASQDDGPGSGPGPAKKLSPLFNHAEKKESSAPAENKNSSPAAVRETVTATTRPAGQQPDSGTARPVSSGPAYKKLQTISIRKKAETTTEEEHTQPPVSGASPENPVTANNEKAFEENELHYQWYRFAAALPKEKSAIAGRMKNMRPHLQAGWHIDVAIENDQVKIYMEEMAPEILAYLRKHLDNGKITLSFHVMEKQEQTRAYSRKEQLAAMLKKSPELVLLRKELELELT